MVVLSTARTLAARLGDLADTTAPESAVRRVILSAVVPLGRSEFSQMGVRVIAVAVGRAQ
jgi:hypothetical protein